MYLTEVPVGEDSFFQIERKKRDVEKVNRSFSLSPVNRNRWSSMYVSFIIVLIYILSLFHSHIHSLSIIHSIENVR